MKLLNFSKDFFFCLFSHKTNGLKRHLDKISVEMKQQQSVRQLVICEEWGRGRQPFHPRVMETEGHCL